jgi:hypothetical protein
LLFKLGKLIQQIERSKTKSEASTFIKIECFFEELRKEIVEDCKEIMLVLAKR